MRSIIALVVFLLWLLLGWKMCTDYAVCCGAEEKVGATEGKRTMPPGVIDGICKTGIICFEKGSCSPQLGSNFEGYRDSLLGVLKGNVQIFEITGLYTTEEKGSDTNLGTCRANEVRQLFASIDESRIKLQSQAVIGRTLNNSERVILNLSSAESAVKDEDRSVASSGAVIYFPYNSTNKLNDAEIEAYLDQVASRVKNSGERIILVGHTDGEGSPEANMRLGQRRANQIADYLIGQGILRSQINASSRGELEPVASNKTEVGRAKNRRTELKIVE